MRLASVEVASPANSRVRYLDGQQSLVHVDPRDRSTTTSARLHALKGPDYDKLSSIICLRPDRRPSFHQLAQNALASLVCKPLAVCFTFSCPASPKTCRVRRPSSPIECPACCRKRRFLSFTIESFYIPKKTCVMALPKRIIKETERLMAEPYVEAKHFWSKLTVAQSPWHQRCPSRREPAIL